jgi:hypothetical protein
LFAPKIRITMPRMIRSSGIPRRPIMHLSTGCAGSGSTTARARLLR